MQQWRAAWRCIPHRRGAAEKASRGIDDPDYGLLAVRWVKPGQFWRIRFLPAFTPEKKPFLRLVQHWWYSHPVVCPADTDVMLIENEGIGKCACCEAGLERSCSFIVYGIQVDRDGQRHPVCLGVGQRYLGSLARLIEDGAMDFDRGHLLVLRPFYRLRARGEARAQQPDLPVGED